MKFFYKKYFVWVFPVFLMLGFANIPAQAAIDKFIIPESEDSLHFDTVRFGDGDGRYRIPDGKYQIRSSLNSKAVIDASNSATPESNVQLYADNASKFQTWKFVYNENKNAYKIYNEANDKVALAWDSHKGNNVIVADGDYDDQYWIIFRASYNNDNVQQYILQNYGSLSDNKVLELANSTDSNGTNVEVGIYDKNKKLTQEWDLTAINDGNYKIWTEVASDKLVDANRPLKNGSNVTVWDIDGDSNQKWKFTYVPKNHAYIVSNLSDPKLLLVQNDDRNVLVSAENNDFSYSSGKYWEVKYSFQKPGKVLLINKAFPGLVLDLYGSETPNGSNIGVHNRYVTDVRNQLWALERIEN